MLLFWKGILGNVSVGLRFGWWKIERKMGKCLFGDGRANVSLCSYCHSFENLKWTKINYQVDFTSWLFAEKLILCTNGKQTNKEKEDNQMKDGDLEQRQNEFAIQGRWRHEVSPESRNIEAGSATVALSQFLDAANSQNNSLVFFSTELYWPTTRHFNVRMQILH